MLGWIPFVDHEDHVLVHHVHVLPDVVQQQANAYEYEGLQGHGDERVRRIDAGVDDGNQERDQDDGEACDAGQQRCLGAGEFLLRRLFDGLAVFLLLRPGRSQ